MNDKSYGGLAAKYGIMPGDFIEVGPHKFFCGDAVLLDEVGALDVFQPAQFSISDPPWNPGNRKMFYGRAGATEQHSFDYFLVGYSDIMAKFAHGTCMIWMGTKFWPRLKELLLERGATTAYVTQAQYGSSPNSKDLHPMQVWVGSMTGEIIQPPQPPTDMYEKHLINWVAEQFIKPNMRLFDPCCGKLYTSGPLIKAGGIMQGCELIPNKLAVGIQWLERYTGKNAKVIHR